MLIPWPSYINEIYLGSGPCIIKLWRTLTINIENTMRNFENIKSGGKQLLNNATIITMLLVVTILS